MVEGQTRTYGRAINQGAQPALDNSRYVDSFKQPGLGIRKFNPQQPAATRGGAG